MPWSTAPSTACSASPHSGGPGRGIPNHRTNSTYQWSKCWRSKNHTETKTPPTPLGSKHCLSPLPSRKKERWIRLPHLSRPSDMPRHLQQYGYRTRFYPILTIERLSAVNVRKLFTFVGPTKVEQFQEHYDLDLEDFKRDILDYHNRNCNCHMWNKCKRFKKNRKTKSLP